MKIDLEYHYINDLINTRKHDIRSILVQVSYVSFQLKYKSCWLYTKVTLLTYK